MLPGNIPALRTSSVSFYLRNVFEPLNILNEYLYLIFYSCYSEWCLGMPLWLLLNLGSLLYIDFCKPMIQNKSCLDLLTFSWSKFYLAQKSSACGADIKPCKFWLFYEQEFSFKHKISYNVIYFTEKSTWLIHPSEIFWLYYYIDQAKLVFVWTTYVVRCEWYYFICVLLHSFHWHSSQMCHSLLLQ